MKSEDFSITTPKPSIFVLMPFDAQFNDIYKFGIKGAAEDIGAYAERVDEQIFVEGMLDRIFNQISRADVIVADMTGRNPNVFYEVGYAHALGKIVLLLTQSADDIPFDLKHRQHLVYQGKIDTLRTLLSERLQWAIAESRQRANPKAGERFLVSYQGIRLPELSSFSEIPVIVEDIGDGMALKFIIRNISAEATRAINHIYLLSKCDSKIIPYGYADSPIESGEEEYPFQQRIAQSVGALPPGAVDEIVLFLKVADEHLAEASSSFVLRLHGEERPYSFLFSMKGRRVRG